MEQEPGQEPKRVVEPSEVVLGGRDEAKKEADKWVRGIQERDRANRPGAISAEAYEEVLSRQASEVKRPVVVETAHNALSPETAEEVRPFGKRDIQEAYSRDEAHLILQQMDQLGVNEVSKAELDAMADKAQKHIEDYKARDDANLRKSRQGARPDTAENAKRRKDWFAGEEGKGKPIDPNEPIDPKNPWGEFVPQQPEASSKSEESHEEETKVENRIPDDWDASAARLNARINELAKDEAERMGTSPDDSEAFDALLLGIRSDVIKEHFRDDDITPDMPRYAEYVHFLYNNLLTPAQRTPSKPGPESKVTPEAKLPLIDKIIEDVQERQQKQKDDWDNYPDTFEHLTDEEIEKAFEEILETVLYLNGLEIDIFDEEAENKYKAAVRKHFIRRPPAAKPKPAPKPAPSPNRIPPLFMLRGDFIEMQNALIYKLGDEAYDQLDDLLETFMQRENIPLAERDHYREELAPLIQRRPAASTRPVPPRFSAPSPPSVPPTVHLGPERGSAPLSAEERRDALNDLYLDTAGLRNKQNRLMRSLRHLTGLADEHRYESDLEGLIHEHMADLGIPENDLDYGYYFNFLRMASVDRLKPELWENSEKNVGKFLELIDKSPAEKLKEARGALGYVRRELAEAMAVRRGRTDSSKGTKDKTAELSGDWKAWVLKVLELENVKDRDEVMKRLLQEERVLHEITDRKLDSTKLARVMNFLNKGSKKRKFLWGAVLGASAGLVGAAVALGTGGAALGVFGALASGSAGTVAGAVAGGAGKLASNTLRLMATFEGQRSKAVEVDEEELAKALDDAVAREAKAASESPEKAPKEPAEVMLDLLRERQEANTEAHQHARKKALGKAAIYGVGVTLVGYSVGHLVHGLISGAGGHGASAGHPSGAAAHPSAAPAHPSTGGGTPGHIGGDTIEQHPAFHPPSPEVAHHFTDAQSTITSGEGWNDVMDKLGVPKDQWADILNKHGAELANIKVDGSPLGYFDQASGEWQLNMTPDGKIPQSALDRIYDWSHPSPNVANAIQPGGGGGGSTGIELAPSGPAPSGAEHLISPNQLGGNTLLQNAADIRLGDGGGQFLQKLNISNPIQQWYSFSNQYGSELLRNHGDEFYRMPDGNIGFLKPGKLSNDTMAYLLNRLPIDKGRFGLAA